MQVTNEQKLMKVLGANKGYITRRQVDERGIPSWFLTDLVRKAGLVKIDKGFYARADWFRDDFLVFQYKYPRFVFSHLSALFLHGLTDRLPESFEVTGPKNYRPFSPDGSVVIHTDSRASYDLGVVDVKTSLGHAVRCYDREKTLCDIIRISGKMDPEVYTKALRLYARSKKKDVGKLMDYARAMKIEKKVSEIMMVVLNED
jgi:predicted transcriptional regulator of viral defense system